MGEQRNLTMENVGELTKKLDEMQKDNPDLEYRFFEQEDTGDAEDTITIVKEIREKLDALDRKLDLIFGDHVLINKSWERR